jgi:hypothetical protein
LLLQGIEENPMLLSMLAFLLFVGCATASPRVAIDNRRIQSSATEKLAAQRAVDPHQRAEDEEARWGIEQSKELKERERQRLEAQKAQGRAGVDVTKSKEEADRTK